MASIRYIVTDRMTIDGETGAGILFGRLPAQLRLMQIHASIHDPATANVDVIVQTDGANNILDHPTSDRGVEITFSPVWDFQPGQTVAVKASAAPFPGPPTHQAAITIQVELVNAADDYDPSIAWVTISGNPAEICRLPGGSPA